MKISDELSFPAESNAPQFRIVEYLPVALALFSILTFSSRDFTDAQKQLFNLGNITRMICVPSCYLVIFYEILNKRLFRIPVRPLAICMFFVYWIVGAFSLVYSEWMIYGLVKFFEYFLLPAVAYYTINIEYYNKGFSKWFYEKTLNFFEFMLASVIVGFFISPSSALDFGTKYGGLKYAVIPFRILGYLINVSTTSVSFLSAILLYSYTVKLVEKQKVRFAPFRISICLVLLSFSQARVAIVGLLCALAFYFLFINRLLYKKLLIGLLGVVSAVFLSNFIIRFLARGQNDSMLYSLSGRTVWWGLAIKEFQHYSLYRKLVGGGFASAEKVVAFQGDSTLYTLDSEYFATLVSTGILGLTCLFLIIAGSFALLKKIRKYDKAGKLPAKDACFYHQIIGIFLIMILRMVVNTTLSIYTSYSVLVMVCLLVLWSILNGKEEENSGQGCIENGSAPDGGF